MNEVGMYAKKPQVVEAVQWPCDRSVLNAWIGPEADVTNDQAGWIYWSTDVGSIAVWNKPDGCWKEVVPGAWIVKGQPEGDFYPCAEEVFHETFAMPLCPECGSLGTVLGGMCEACGLSPA